MAAVIEEKRFRGMREIIPLCLTVVALFMLMALATFNHEDPGWSRSGTGQSIANACGVLGARLADFMLSWFGLMAYTFPLAMLIYGVLHYRGVIRDDRLILGLRAGGFLLCLLTGTSLLFLYPLRLPLELPRSSSGILGETLGEYLVVMLGNSGATLLVLACALTGFTLLTGMSWLALMDWVGRCTLNAARRLFHRSVAAGSRYWTARREARHVAQTTKAAVKSQKTVAITKTVDASVPVLPNTRTPTPGEAATPAPVVSVVRRKSSAAPVPQYSGELPPVELLDLRESKVKGYSDKDLEELSRLIETILQDFGVSVNVVDVHPGPVITRFEVLPAAGVKVSRISGLSKDLARAMSVTSVRVVEVIPGKSVVGLEIPNREREMVSLRDVLASPHYAHARSPLTLVLGKDISGQPVVEDLAKMPHLLVAGTTGSGKSVAINAMILSMLFKATPEQVRMIMVDPKMLELSVYDGIPHLLTPVVTDMKEAANALRWSVAEMERRYKLLSKLGVRNIKGYNQLIKDAEAQGESIADPLFAGEEGGEAPALTTLPYIVIIIDELADMMMIVGKKVEELIARLAQKARAAGIHLILATQRPSVDVLTGLIKANIPSRVAFQVSSRIDSRTILDQGGAETLLGNGDMLYLLAGTSIPTRAHGAFVDDHEVHHVVDFLKLTAPPNYLEDITKEISEASDGNGFSGLPSAESGSDALYDEAVRFVIDSRKASISSVQRRFKIGYNRAARLIEDMEAAGIVSAAESNGSREVLISAMAADE